MPICTVLKTLIALIDINLCGNHYMHQEHRSLFGWLCMINWQQKLDRALETRELTLSATYVMLVKKNKITCSSPTLLTKNSQGSVPQHQVTYCPQGWNHIINWLLQVAKSKKIKARIRRATFTAVIYNIWLEKNARAHRRNKKILGSSHQAESRVCTK